MEVDKKPKCRGCNVAGSEETYFFQAATRGKGGHLWHFTCYVRTGRTVHKNVEEAMEKLYGSVAK